MAVAELWTLDGIERFFAYEHNNDKSKVSGGWIERHFFVQYSLRDDSISVRFGGWMENRHWGHFDWIVRGVIYRHRQRFRI